MLIDRLEGGTVMQVELIRLYSKIFRIMNREEGQDLVEYALIVALVALGATAGMNSLAADINLAFSNIGTSLTSTLA
jgi:pilus assembly protein Flp/PilA